MPPKKKKVIKKEESESDSENSFSTENQEDENEINEDDEEDKLNDGDIGIDDEELIKKEKELNENNDDDDCIYRINKNEEVEFEDEDDEDDDPDIEKVDNDNIYVDKNDRISRPYITKYERVRILSDRAKQLETGAQSTIKIENIKDLNVKEIAKLELSHNKIPFFIERKMPNGKIEQWTLDEFKNVDTLSLQSGGEKKLNEFINKAGVILFLKKNNDYYVPLFKHTKRNTWVSLGGTSDFNDKDLKETASREAKEETFDSLIIKSHVLDDDNSYTFSYKKNKASENKYKVYFILINNYEKLEKIYNKNKNNYKKITDDYDSKLETKEIKLFNLKNFNKKSDETTILINDDEIWRDTYNSLVHLKDYLNNNDVKKNKCTTSKNNFIIE